MAAGNSQSCLPTQFLGTSVPFCWPIVSGEAGTYLSLTLMGLCAPIRRGPVGPPWRWLPQYGQWVDYQRNTGRPLSREPLGPGCCVACLLVDNLSERTLIASCSEAVKRLQMPMTFDLESKWQGIMAFHMAACLHGLQFLCSLPPKKDKKRKKKNCLNSKHLSSSVAKRCHQICAESLCQETVEKSTRFIK